jgi:hypothetical protein
VIIIWIFLIILSIRSFGVDFLSDDIMNKPQKVFLLSVGKFNSFDLNELGLVFLKSHVDDASSCIEEAH